MSNIALILAGGRGTRFNSMRPKQYIEVDGKPILSYTMRAFEKHPLVTDIYVVCSPEWNTYVEAQAGHNAFTKFRTCIASGETSFRSMSNGIKALVTMGIDPDSIIMVHSLSEDQKKDLIEGDVITFRQGGIEKVHRIIEIETDGTPVTKGDANQSPDPAIAPEDIDGKVVGVAPTVGKIVSSVRDFTSDSPVLIIIGVALIIIMIYSIVEIIKIVRNKDEENE